MNSNFLIPANSKKGQLIFNMFRMVDLIILCSGAVASFILLLALQPDSIVVTIIVLLPILVCAFLVIPVANYHNILCIIENVYKFYFVEKQQYPWKGWCVKDEFKD